MHAELLGTLRLLQAMMDLWFDSICRVSNNADILDESNPLYRSGKYVCMYVCMNVCILSICAHACMCIMFVYMYVGKHVVEGS